MTEPSAEPDAVDLVGLVVVSHSRPLARAVLSLARQMLHDSPVRIAVAAGLDEATLGTDAVAVKQAIEQVAGPAGVVVLMDLGSAVLSAELALELLDDPEVRARVVLSGAPLVEGLVVAAVTAAGGAGRQQVAAEAQNALQGKAMQLSGPEIAQPPDEPQLQQLPNAAEVADAAAEFTVVNEHGLHARPAARLVSELRGLDAQVRLRNLATGAGPVSAASLSRLVALGIQRGHRVQALATGRQARTAIDRLLALAARQFGEIPTRDEPSTAAQERAAGPVPASPGIGIGPVRRLSYPATAARAVRCGSPADEWHRIEQAVTSVRRGIERYRTLADQDAPQAAAIFDAHLLLLDDEELLRDVKTRLSSGTDAVTACVEAFSVVERQWSQLPDPYLQARAADVRAVGAQVVAALTGADAVTMNEPGILVADDLTPGQAADLDGDSVRGIVLAYGSPSSHAAILARAKAIPVIVAAGPAVLELADGTVIAFDGGTGELSVDPSEADLALFSGRSVEQAGRRNAQLAASDSPAYTTDGTRIEVEANLSSAADALVAARNGADGAGLVRTEFLFLGRDVAPDVQEQVRQYLAIAEAMPGRRIALRTLDVGGDKPLPYLPMPAEDNPYLGNRGLRILLQRPQLLLDQLTAICAVARHARIDLMFPMVSTVAEFRAARQLLAKAAGPGGLPDGLRVGMMVEVPAAALKIERFVPELDFISIGTNDLTQYTLAAERGNAAVAALSDGLDPGVLSLIQQVCRAAAELAAVAVCGELAADPVAIPALIGLGVRRLSVAAPSVPAVKARVRELDVARCAAVARAALDLDDAGAVRELLARTPV